MTRNDQACGNSDEEHVESHQNALSPTNATRGVRSDGDSGSAYAEGAGNAETVESEQTSEVEIITDFDDGLDAIELMIQAFGFEDIELLKRERQAPVLRKPEPPRLVATSPKATGVRAPPSLTIVQ
ncbi:MAG: hypothetical protein AB8B85_20435 [Paracoccaceae bacterium]